MVSAAGYRMSFTVVDAEDIPALIYAVMPDAIIIYRWVFGQSDPNPRGPNDVFVSGQDWKNRLWPYMVNAKRSTYFQFVNEWEGNFEPLDFYRKFAKFYTELGDATLPLGIVPTFGDFSVGTPPDADNIEDGEAERYALLKPMFDYAVAHQVPVNFHLYSMEGPGAYDMEPGAAYWFMRFEQTAKRYPGLKIIAGEGSNFGVNLKIFDAVKTPLCMKQAARMLRASAYWAQFEGLHWWGVVDGKAHPDWKDSDCTPILPWFFTWSINGQPV